MACVATCYQIERRPDPNSWKVISATANPDKAPCNAAANKAVAENGAKAAVEKDEAAKNESVDNCAQQTTPANPCGCPPWPPWPAGGWKVTHNGLTAVKKVPIPGIECVWTVILQYDRQERMRSANCKWIEFA